MTPTEQHELEKLLADVAGVEVQVNYEGLWVTSDPTSVYWRPLTDANQMERVKAGLGLIGFSITRARGEYSVKIWNEHPQMGSPNVWGARHPCKESLAFAIAVMAMKEHHEYRKP